MHREFNHTGGELHASILQHCKAVTLAPMSHILIVDDEPSVASSLKLLLERTGYQTTWASDGRAALELLKSRNFDLVLLDVNLGDPLLDGLAVCRAIRSLPAYTPVIMLTVRDGATDKVVGLEVGADDYITKPIKPKLFLSRIKALLRRTQISGEGSVITVGNITIDKEKHLVIKDEKPIEMPKKEFMLLELLASKPGKVFSREYILEKVWGDDVIVGERTIDVHIRKIREKIGEDYIKTVKGIGYKLEY
jgi:two-component system alkaline phosphatase synthesis response regulator PhoP